MRERANARFVPSRSVTVAFEARDRPRAYGVVANLSDGGACLWTDARLEAGQQVSLAVSFARAPRPVAAQARVVWIRPETGSGTRRYGVQWDAEAPEALHLRRLISESA
jgi:Tfp pilus assembly protein PilZ